MIGEHLNGTIVSGSQLTNELSLTICMNESEIFNVGRYLGSILGTVTKDGKETNYSYPLDKAYASFHKALSYFNPIQKVQKFVASLNSFVKDDTNQYELPTPDYINILSGIQKELRCYIEHHLDIANHSKKPLLILLGENHKSFTSFQLESMIIAQAAMIESFKLQHVFTEIFTYDPRHQTTTAFIYKYLTLDYDLNYHAMDQFRCEINRYIGCDEKYLKSARYAKLTKHKPESFKLKIDISVLEKYKYIQFRDLVMSDYILQSPHKGHSIAIVGGRHLLGIKSKLNDYYHVVALFLDNTFFKRFIETKSKFESITWWQHILLRVFNYSKYFEIMIEMENINFMLASTPNFIHQIPELIKYMANHPKPEQAKRINEFTKISYLKFIQHEQPLDLKECEILTKTDSCQESFKRP